MPRWLVNEHLHPPLTRSSFLSVFSNALWSHFLVLLFVFKSRIKAPRFGVNAPLQGLGIKVCCLGFPKTAPHAVCVLIISSFCQAGGGRWAAILTFCSQEISLHARTAAAESVGSPSHINKCYQH